MANGVAPHANPPVHWSETNNIRWKIPLPGKGHSSPVVFGDAVFLLAALPVGEAQKPVFDDAPGVHDSVPVTHRHQFVALAIKRRDGGISWLKSLLEEWPHEGGHVTGSLASNSPVTDGERLYVFFGNSYYEQAMLAIRLDGAKGDLTGTDRVAWRLNRSTPHVSSPLLYDDTLYFLRHNQRLARAGGP